MPAPRRFDHDDARKRYKRGEAISDLARRFGVTPHAVWYVVHPDGPAAQKRVRDAYYDRNRVPCEDCGNPTLSLAISGKRQHNPDGRALCRRCRADARTERFRFNNAGLLVAVRCQSEDCASGDRWQPPSNFPRGTRSHHVREGGIHGQCRACLTRARREYRRRHPEKEVAANLRARLKRRAKARA